MVTIQLFTLCLRESGNYPVVYSLSEKESSNYPVVYSLSAKESGNSPVVTRCPRKRVVTIQLLLAVREREW